MVYDVARSSDVFSSSLTIAPQVYIWDTALLRIVKWSSHIRLPDKSALQCLVSLITITLRFYSIFQVHRDLLVRHELPIKRIFSIMRSQSQSHFVGYLI